MSWLVVLRPAREGVEGEHELLGIGVFDGRERSEIEAIPAEDPAIASGATQAEIRPLRIVTR